VYGIQWARALRPGLQVLHAMSRFGKGGFSGACGHGYRILSKTLGAMLTRIPLASLRRPPSAITGEELEIATLLQSCMPDYSAYYSLRPEYNRESLKWLLDFMTQMKAYENLRRVALRDVTRQRIGCLSTIRKVAGLQK